MNITRRKNVIYFTIALLITTFGCVEKKDKTQENEISIAIVEPRVITDTVEWDTDDPAIWINHTDPSKSLVVGTDKGRLGHQNDGALYAFNLEGKIITSMSLNRPNNVDIAYNFPFNGDLIDIAVVTERYEQRIRAFKLPELELIDEGDLIVFDGNTERAPMGIAMYNRKKDNSFYVFVSGKSGPKEGYIGQYLLESNDQNKIELTPVREFGRFSGIKEIEAIAVDNELGYVYYSDEICGVRKYHADPDKQNADLELALFATEGFAKDQEGISIYKKTDKTGYILVSDQHANKFWIYPREGTLEDPHEHRPIKIIKASTILSDGNATTNKSLPGFPTGLFVAMSDDKTFQYYSWEDIAGEDLN